MNATLPLRRTTPGDFFDAGAGVGAVGRVVGARLASGGAAATAQITDQDGTVLYDLAAPNGYADESDSPTRFVQKVTLASITGAGASVIVYLE